MGPQAEADAVRAAVQATTACGNSTISKLARLLGLSNDSTDAGGVGKPIVGRIPKPPAKPISTKRTTTKRTADTLVKNQSTESSLTSKQRVRLATDVVNATLKVLTEQAKATTADRPIKSALDKSQARAQTHNRAVRQCSPLAEIINQSVRLEKHDKPLPFPQTGGHADGLESIVECSRLAFRYLRTQAKEDVGNQSTSVVQLQAGMLAMIGKLILLGYDTVAIRELYLLKPLIQDRSTAELALPANNKELLASLLAINFQHATSTGQMNMVVSFQNHVLRLVMSTRSPTIIAAVAPLLEPSDSKSPCAAILQSIETGTDPAKAARQLEQHAQTVLALARSLDEARPESSLRLRASALGIRKTWWPLAAHQVDLEEEIYRPLIQDLTSFWRCCNSTAKDKYQVVLEIQQKLIPNVATTDTTESAMGRHAFANTMSMMAEAAEQCEDAKFWNQCSMIKHDTNAATVDAVSAVRAALLELELLVASGKSLPTGWLPQFNASLEIVTKKLSETQQLVSELAQIRKVALKRLSAAMNANKKNSPFSSDQSSLCIIQFKLVRAVERLSSSEQTARAITVKVSQSFIESAIFAAKLWLASDQCVEEIQDVSYRCAHLLQLQHADHGNLHVQMSNLYWLLFQKATQSALQAPTPPLTYLLESTKLLEACNEADQNDGMLAMKLERLSSLYLQSGSYPEAFKTLTQALMLCKHAYTIRTLAERSRAEPLPKLLDALDGARSLQRLLSSHYEAALRVKSASTVFNNKRLPADSQVTLLMIQLPLLERHLGERIVPPSVVHDLDTTLDTLLNIPTEERQPLRGMQIRTRLLSIAIRNPTIVSKSLVQDALDFRFDISSMTDDQDLLKYSQHVSRSYNYAKALLAENMSCLEILSVLEHWGVMLDISTSRSALEQNIDDLDAWAGLLKSGISILRSKGEARLALLTERLLWRLMRLDDDLDRTEFLAQQTSLARSFLQCGFSKPAVQLLSMPAHRNGGAAVSVTMKADTHLARCEVALCIGDHQQAICALDAFSELIRSGGMERASKTWLYQKQAEAGLLNSISLLERGLHADSVQFGKESVRMYKSLFAHISQSRLVSDNSATSTSDQDLNQLSKGLEGLQVSASLEENQHPCDALSFSFRSQHLNAGFLQTLMHMARLYMHLGMVPEAEYYVQQLARTAQALDGRLWLIESTTLKLELAALTGAVQTPGDGCYESTNPSDAESGISLRDVRLRIANADLCASSGLLDKALEEYQQAQTWVERLISDSQRFTDQMENCLKEGISTTGVTLAPGLKKKAAMVSTTKSRKQATTKPSRRPPQPLTVPEDNRHVTRETMLDVRRALLQRQTAIIYLRQGDIEAAGGILTALQEPHGGCDLTKHEMVLAREALVKAGHQMLQNVTYSIVPESTIAMPSWIEDDGRSHTKSSLPSSKAVSKPSTKGRSARNDSSELARLLLNAREKLSSGKTTNTDCMSVATAYEVSSLLATTTMLLSIAQAVELPKGVLHPARAAYALELPSIMAMQRQLQAVHVDKQHRAIQDLLVAESVGGARVGIAQSSASASRFQEDYIDILPSSWTAISLHMNEMCTELWIVKYQRERLPFILRLPMARHKADDLDGSTTFDFEAGRAELQDIKQCSDFSCHNAPDTSTKGAKTSWWAEREALDNRMHELLVNMENIWLGGFKGVLAQHTRRPELLARFGKSFEGILERHLPSRQGTKAHTKKLRLDSHVLELFIGLGNDADQLVELDEQVLDLLYFVIDVLQFHGEANAYDEVDFDSMTIDTLDAMRAYQEAVPQDSEGNKHTVLILDKRLHKFPWESLPCLQGLSVSRVGNMLHLQERLLAMRRQQQQRAEKGSMADYYTMQKPDGTFILNPSGDLTKTQQCLEPYLNPLQVSEGWSTIIGRAPSEAEFKHALTESGCLLYFGHGSGNQYIRNRTIRKLDKCSQVVWLMGCSSGSVTEYGALEPVSVPLAYLAAGTTSRISQHASGGSPSKDLEEVAVSDINPEPSERIGICMAVIATLWDVTDRDIDRFSAQVGQKWGLLGPDSPSAPFETPVNAMPKTPGKRARSVPKTPGKTPVKTPGKTPGRNRPIKAEKGLHLECRKSLVAAVAQSRDSCYLRYLNGAAPVVYGVPVYLEP